MSQNKYLMGIDNGGTATKVALFMLPNVQVASCSVRSETFYPRAGFAEKDMTALWYANCDAIKKCIQSCGIDPKDIAAVGLSGHGKGLYPLMRDGSVLCRGILSADSRAERYVGEWRKNGVQERVFPKICQKVLACQPVSLLRWIKDNDGTLYDNIGWVLSIKDFIRFKLTGEINTEITDISGTSLLNLRTRDYDKTILSEFGIDDVFSKLPPIIGSADIGGYITAQAAEMTGLCEGTPVAGGMFDIDACALGMGLANSDNVCVIGGTWSINEYISKTPVLDVNAAMNSLYCIPGYYLVEECSPTSAANLEWVLKTFFRHFIDECGGINGKLFSKVNAMVESAGVEETDMVFLPFLFASNEEGNIKSGLINMTADNSPEQILRAVYEGVVFSHMHHLDRLLSTRSAPKKILLAGGIANSEVWTKMLTDTVNIPVEALPDFEHGCFGAAIAAGICANIFNSYQDAVKNVPSGRLYFPNKDNHNKYMNKYNRYKDIVSRLK